MRNSKQKGVGPNDDPLQGHPKYQKERHLGGGGQGAVQLCRNKLTGEMVAIKFILLGGNTDVQYVLGEAINQRRLTLSGFPHVVAFKEVFVLQEYLCIAMEWVNGGSLIEYVNANGGRLDERGARWFFQQLIIAIDYCHKKGVVNRDIKLENTLLKTTPGGTSWPVLKLCDFGYSKANDLSQPHSKVGTPEYMPPEVMTSTGSYDGVCCDVWCCGVLLYAMMCGNYPFRPNDTEGGSEAAKMRRRLARMTQPPEWPADLTASPEAREFITALLSCDPARRPRVAQILKDPWFLTGLPAGTLEWNEKYLEPDENYLRAANAAPVQTEEEIRNIIVHAAGIGSGGLPAAAYFPPAPFPQAGVHAPVTPSPVEYPTANPAPPAPVPAPAPAPGLPAFMPSVEPPKSWLCFGKK